MNLQQLTTFCTVISEGSMTAAAEKLFLTQPAVSQQIRNLEEELGVELLVRGVRNVKATMQGQLLYEYSKKILHLTQQAQVAIQTISQEIVGEYRLATLNSLGLYMISPILGLFLKHNSRLHVKLAYGEGRQILQKLQKGELDIAILPESEAFKREALFDNLDRKFISKDEFWLVGSSRDTGIPHKIDLRSVSQRPIVHYTETYADFQAYLSSKLNETHLDLHPVFESDNVGTLKRVIESGLGWGFLPAHSIHKQVRTGRLSRVEVEGFSYQVDLVLYSRRDPRLQTVVDVLFRALNQTQMT